ncbi:MAG: hypothetical protein Q8891_06335 [Bacteroidota bacterium]|nr:hypothetical protein [Bacteroidota bacterium]
MQTIDDKLEKITDAWNNYFWEYKFCQDQINFTDEIKTNYYGDILSYFNDTLSNLSNVKYESTFQKSIFQSVGFLQLIYTHQDLIDELLYIFNLPKSSKIDKSPNREIRNELVGHPIRRNPRTNEFISSVFFGREFKNGMIHYILYDKGKIMSSKSLYYSIDEIIERHRSFLVKYLDIILSKIKTVLKRYQKQLLELNNLINKGIAFTKIVKLVELRYNKIAKEDYLFKPDILRECFLRQNEHPRYKNAIDLYLKTLKEYLPETIRLLEELFEPPKKQEYYKPVKIKIVSSSNTASPISKEKELSYEFSKLLDNHPIFGISYFKNKFRRSKIILKELINMENNISNTLEFYSSYEYLRILFIKRKLLRR